MNQTLLPDLAPGPRHCCLCENAAEHGTLLVAYPRQGLEPGEEGVYLPRHGGRIWAEVEPVRDSTFHFPLEERTSHATG